MNCEVLSGYFIDTEEETPGKHKTGTRLQNNREKAQRSQRVQASVQHTGGESEAVSAEMATLGSKQPFRSTSSIEDDSSVHTGQEWKACYTRIVQPTSR